MHAIAASADCDNRDRTGSGLSLPSTGSSTLSSRVNRNPEVHGKRLAAVANPADEQTNAWAQGDDAVASSPEIIHILRRGPITRATPAIRRCVHFVVGEGSRETCRRLLRIEPKSATSTPPTAHPMHYLVPSFGLHAPPC